MRDDLTDEEKQKVENELKKLESLNASSGIEAIDSSLSPEQEEYLNQKLPKDPFKDLEMTYENWQSSLVQKHENLYKTVNENMPELWIPLNFALSIKTVLNIKGCTLPFAGILLGPPSSLKSQVVELFRKWKSNYFTDSFTPRSFVSHYAGQTEEKLKKIDMLPKIKDKMFLCSELSPMFMKKEEELNELIGLFTRVLDGHGLTSDTGACGQRKYEGEYMFTWLGAAVDIPYRAHKLMGSIGPKLYFLRLPKKIPKEDDLLAGMENDDFIPKMNKVRIALLEYLDWFDRCPIDEEKVTRENNLIKIQWDNQKDDEYAKRIIARIALLLARLRGVVPTRETHGTQGLDYAYATAMLEDPRRAVQQLKNLARGHALGQGRNWITIGDLPLPIKVVMSTASIDRTNIFRLLIAHKGKLTTKIIDDSLNTTYHTSHRIMAELKAVELVDLKESETRAEEKEITLKQEFDWFLTEEFQELLGGFEGSDNSEYVKAFVKKYNISLEEKRPPCNTELSEEVEQYTRG